MVSTAQNAALAQQEGNRLLDGISVPYAVVQEYNHTVDLATQSRFEEMEPTIKKTGRAVSGCIYFALAIRKGSNGARQAFCRFRRTRKIS